MFRAHCGPLHRIDDHGGRIRGTARPLSASWRFVCFGEIAALVHCSLFRFELLACHLTTDQVSKPPEGQPAIKSCKSDHDKWPPMAILVTSAGQNPHAVQVAVSLGGGSVTHGFGEMDMLAPVHATSKHKSRDSEYSY